IRSYLTLNTVLYDNDLDSMKKIINTVKEKDISAIIASDQAVLSYAGSIGIEIHLSTQVNISNLEALKFYARFAEVIVLARELTLDQIAGISKAIEDKQIKGPSGNLIRIELFAHGALCMAISGKCYLSLHEANSSANRGACLQICRRAYTVKEKETGNELEINNEYIMSPKDLNTIGFLNKILDAGVKLFKIEGRARSPEYVKTVVECYDEAVRSIINGTYNDKEIKEWERRLSMVFNRGFWGGYYLGKRLGEWNHRYGSRATKRKIYLGKITNYFSRIQVAEFKIETGFLNVNDEILIIGPTTGVIQSRVKEIRINLKNVAKTKKGEVCSIPVSHIVRRSDKLYKLVDAVEVQQQ
ncbi:MAG: U32 family peptidase, partial [Bacteroidales bacterium]|nr:U32 family peptidase [Bacteroidales bacterium]